ncbi:hypothetical protein DPMN_175325 [Dreissena polymorpha]|uniref:Parvovirus non-structural protein 1 helicase domain-containing protein n=1 Tax=Dreissena polymorpha TaxID=45954 RepID=A0A9D4E7Y7_DREPO|nr:hypothetical protein DPMN_175325 [Dreissena polymorpha]
MLQFAVTNWATPIATYQKLSKTDAEYVNHLKRFLNNNICALLMHDGTTDDACRINGFHLHILVQNDTSNHLCRNNHWRTIRGKISKIYKVKTARIVRHKEFYMHMLSAPRVFMGVNNLEFKNRLLGVYLRDSELALFKHQLTDIEMAAQMTLNQVDELESENESDDSEEGAANAFIGLLGRPQAKRKRRSVTPEAPVLSMYYMDPADYKSRAREPPSATLSLEDINRGETAPQRQRPSKSSINIDNAKNLMTKYNRLSSDELFVAICRGGDATDIFQIEQLRALPYAGKVFLSAADDLHLLAQVNDKDYIDIITNMKIENKELYLPYAETVEVLGKWFRDQKVNKVQFIKAVYKVMSMQSAKKNTIYLQGDSNAGKTWLFRSLLPDMSLVGQTSESIEFKWQNLVDKFVGLVSELTITTIDMANKCKEIFGGEPSQVNIKNKLCQLLSRTPKLLSSNALVWDHFANEANPLRNRMYIFPGSPFEIYAFSF